LNVFTTVKWPVVMNAEEQKSGLTEIARSCVKEGTTKCHINMEERQVIKRKERKAEPGSSVKERRRTRR
jgi:hypothetical protein